MAHLSPSTSVDDAEAAESVAQEVRKLGVGCMVIPGDVAKSEDAQRIVSTVLEKWQRIDVLVNNAGITKNSSHKR